MCWHVAFFTAFTHTVHNLIVILYNIRLYIMSSSSSATSAFIIINIVLIDGMSFIAFLSFPLSLPLKFLAAGLCFLFFVYASVICYDTRETLFIKNAFDSLLVLKLPLFNPFLGST